MPVTTAGIVGPPSSASLAPNTPANTRLGQAGDTIVQELHGRFYEQLYRGNVYHVGHAGLVALASTTITLTSTSTPILGIYNPSTSLFNAVLLQCALTAVVNTVTTPVGAGAFVW